MAENIIEFKNVTKHYDDVCVLENINLAIKQGEFITLLGPSGCGKTTLLRLISGFENPDDGHIFLNGQNIQQFPPHQRLVHTVFQSYALFPHMSVFENIAFGLTCRKVPTDEINAKVSNVLKMVKLEHLAKRKPTQLSGGQQQRVAIARAVVNQPLALLLDEPLSSLDYRLRKTMQIELKQLQRKLGITFVFVTHDQEEALSMSDRVVVMHGGKIQQIGTPRDVYENPQNLSVASFVGEANIFDAQVLHATEREFTVRIEELELKLFNRNHVHTSEKVFVVIRPEDIRVWSQNEITAEESKSMLTGTVEEVIYKGTTVDLMVRLSSNKIIAATEFFDEDDEKLEYGIGEPVWVNWLPGWEVILPHDE
ncbi:MAG: spermidine/putrescine ABC transporter ATP-binding protein PotA [Gammaproteobacteria bacterium]